MIRDRIRTKPKHILPLALFTAIGCSSTEFASSPGQRSPTTVNQQQTGTPEELEQAELPVGEEDATAKTPVAPEPLPPQANDDGSISERFFGLSGMLQGYKTDIVIAVDTSTSMGTEKQKVEANMAAFFEKLESLTGLDFQVFVIGGPSRIPGTDITGTLDLNFTDLNPDKFDHVKEPVDSGAALVKIRSLLAGDLSGTLALRPDSVKELLVVSDDNSSLRADNFRSFLEDNKAELGKVHLNGFVWVPGETNNGFDWCTRASDGRDYVELGADPEYGGLIEHLCTEDWGALFDKLAKKIVNKQAKLVFELSKTPDLSDVFEVLLNGEPVDEQAWRFDKEKNTLVFEVEAAPQSGDLIEVNYLPL